jgi:hypothetical protein
MAAKNIRHFDPRHERRLWLEWRLQIESIKRALHVTDGFECHAGITRRRGQVAMAKQVLNGPDIGTTLK